MKTTAELLLELDLVTDHLQATMGYFSGLEYVKWQCTPEQELEYLLSVMLLRIFDETGPDGCLVQEDAIFFSRTVQESLGLSRGDVISICRLH